MAPFDYTTSANVFAYGQPSGTPSAGETTLMASLVTAISRTLDTYCNQTLYATTYSQQVNRAQVDVDGILLAWLPVPTLSALTAADCKPANSTTWNSISLSDASHYELSATNSGSQVRFLGDYSILRGSRPQLRLSYTGGWADIAAVPSNFEWAMRTICWWEYKKREAPISTMGNPSMGIVIVPASWPDHIREKFRPYVRQLPI
jgi:hypothetical protein